MIAGSPAWNPHATFAEEMLVMTSASIPIPSPVSLFRSIEIIRVLQGSTRFCGVLQGSVLQGSVLQGSTGFGSTGFGSTGFGSTGFGSARFYKVLQGGNGERTDRSRQRNGQVPLPERTCEK